MSTQEVTEGFTKAINSEFNTMTLVQADGKLCAVQYHWDSTIFDVMEEVRNLLIAGGFHPDTVEDGFQYMVNEYFEDVD